MAKHSFRSVPTTPSGLAVETSQRRIVWSPEGTAKPLPSGLKIAGIRERPGWVITGEAGTKVLASQSWTAVTSVRSLVIRISRLSGLNAMPSTLPPW